MSVWFAVAPLTSSLRIDSDKFSNLKEKSKKKKIQKKKSGCASAMPRIQETSLRTSSQPQQTPSKAR
jgi:hypothetical protein